MDSLFRILNWLLILAAFSFAFSTNQAHAETTAPTIYWDNQHTPDPGFASRLAGKTATCQAVGGTGQSGSTDTSQPPVQDHVFDCFMGGTTWTYGYHIYGSAHCPDSTWTKQGTWPNETCYREDPPPPDPCADKAGQQASAGLYDIGTSPEGEMPSTACDQGCLVSFSGTSPAYTALQGGVRHYYASGSYTYSDFECSGGSGLPAALSSPPPDTCGAGQTSGTVNGKTVCVDTSTGQPAPTTPPPPETETEETAPPVTNQDGSTTTTTTKTHSDGSTTTTTTTTNPDGSSTTSTVTTPAPDSDGLDDYCENNPDSIICKEEEQSSWGGSCGGFTCEGDAIQCAIAREQHNRNCQLFETESAESQLYNSVTAGTDSGTLDNPARQENREIINLPTTLDTSNGGISGGLSDVSVGVMGSTLTLPFASLNPFLELMGFIVLGFSYFRAYKIVGGVK